MKRGVKAFINAPHRKRPQWLRELHEEAKRKGLDKLTMSDIDAEIAASPQGEA